MYVNTYIYVYIHIYTYTYCCLGACCPQQIHSRRYRPAKSKHISSFLRTCIVQRSAGKSALKRVLIIQKQKEYSEVADSDMPELDPMKRRLTWTIYATPLMTRTTHLGLSIRVSMFEHVDWWLEHLPRSPGMGEGGEWWIWPMGVIAEGIPRREQR